jgi:hypothetical protein
VVWFRIDVFIRRIDITQPISQYGVYPETRQLFTAVLIAASIFATLFGVHLKRHHDKAHLLAFAASLCFAWVGIVAYDNVYLFLGISHWISALLSGLLYLLLIVVVESNKKHSFVRSVFFIATLMLTIVAGVAVYITDNISHLLVFELFSILSIQLWLGLTSIDEAVIRPYF